MNLHPPLLNLTLSQKGAHYSGIRLFNHLPVHIKQLAGDINPFKSALKTCCGHTPFTQYKNIYKQSWSEWLVIS
jgi:hypothetical protein